MMQFNPVNNRHLDTFLPKKSTHLSLSNLIAPCVLEKKTNIILKAFSTATYQHLEQITSNHSWKAIEAEKTRY